MQLQLAGSMDALYPQSLVSMSCCPWVPPGVCRSRLTGDREEEEEEEEGEKEGMGEGWGFTSTSATPVAAAPVRSFHPLNVRLLCKLTL